MILYSLVGGVIAGLMKSYTMKEAILLGLHCARLSVQSVSTVPSNISADTVLNNGDLIEQCKSLHPTVFNL